MALKPLMLKDFLEIDANSDSCDEFRCAQRRPEMATVRCLINAELGGRLIRTRSNGALTRLSAVINAVKRFSSSSGCRQNQGGFLPRSFSKKLRRNLWKRKGEEAESEGRVMVRDIVRLRSFEEDVEERRSLYFPSPVVSSCSSLSDDGDSSGSDFLLSSCGSSEFFGENDAAAAAGCGDEGGGDSPKKSLNPNPNASPKERSDVVAGDDYRPTDGGRLEPKMAEGKEMEIMMCHPEEEEEQLSPVSVMDFPYHEEEEEEDATSPCFHQTLANIERTRHQLLHKIRRFESLAEMDPVNLDTRFASFEEPLESIDHVASDEDSSERAAASSEVEEERAWKNLLQPRAPWDPNQRSIEKLLEDFFVEGLSSSLDCSTSLQQWRRPTKTSPLVPVEQELMKAVSDWLAGGDGGCAEEDGGALLKEMERNGGWRCFEKEEEEVAAQLEGRLLGSLLDELVLDLVSC